MGTRWRTASGKVHIRRQRWYAGTPDERAADPELNIMLCGQRRYLTEVPDDTEATCRSCINARAKNEGS